MERDETTAALLHRARSAWATGNHAVLADAFRRLDLKLQSGHLVPDEWRKPLMPLVEQPGGRYEVGDTMRLTYALHAELMDAELDLGGRMCAGRDHDSVDLMHLAQRLTARIVREVKEEREALHRIATEMAYQNLRSQMATLYPVGGSFDGS